MKRFFLLFLLCMPYLLMAQADPSINNFKNQTSVFPPSPNAAALAKFAEIPVNKHTGIPQIGVPIFSWASRRGQVKLDISLSYHAGGIKVEDIASSSGLGWSLSAGGMITRSIKGKQDDEVGGYINTYIIDNYNTSLYQNGYYLAPEPSPTLLTDISAELQYCDTNRNKIIGYYNDPGNNSFLADAFNGNIDTEQDIFYYNAFGNSGKFVLNKDGGIQKIDISDIEILVEYDIDGLGTKRIARFVIIDERGLKYVFDKKEISNSITVTTSADPADANSINTDYKYSTYTSTFHVSKVVDLNSSDTILFEYSSRELHSVSGWNESAEFFIAPDRTGRICEYVPVNGIPIDLNHLPRKTRQTISQTHTKNQVFAIKRIVLPDQGTFEFFYDSARLDLDGDSTLNRVVWNDGFGNSRKYKLTYGYSGSQLVSNPSSETWIVNTSPYYTYNSNHFTKRLRLDKVEQVSASGSEFLLINAFEYNDTLLPPRNSKAIDLWGYYYGPNRFAHTLLPQLPLEVAENIQGEGLQLDPYPTGYLLNEYTYGVNRTPDSSYARAGILKKVILSTGGVTNFHFKSNTVKQPLYYDYGYKMYTQTTPVIIPATATIPLNTPNRQAEGVFFTIDFTRVNSDGTLYTPPAQGSGLSGCLSSANGSFGQMMFEVRSSDGIIIKNTIFSGVEQGSGKVYVYFDLPLNKFYSIKYYYVNPNADPCLNGYFKIQSTAKYTSSNKFSLVGGVRIETIEYKASSAETSLKTVFSYNGDDTLTSGKINVVPNYSANNRAVGKYIIIGMEDEFLYDLYKSRTSSSTQTLGYSFGANIGYSKVAVKNLDIYGNDLGRSEYYYSSGVVKNIKETYPYADPQHIDWASGHPLMEKFLDRYGNVVKKTHYNYYDIVSEYNNEKNRSVKIASIYTFVPRHTTGTVNDLLKHRFVAHAYYPFYGRSFLTTKRDVEFSGADSISTLTTYSYYPGTARLKGKQISYDSKGKKIETIYFYPEEFTHTAMQQLVNNHVKGIAVSARTYQKLGSPVVNQPLGDDEPLIHAEGMEYNIYGAYARPNKFFEALKAEDYLASPPSINFSTVMQSSDIVIGEVTQYDSYGNICEMIGKDGIVQSVIWGYKGTKPIAKVIGLNYNAALAAITSVSYTGLQSLTSDADIRSKINEIRVAYNSNNGVQVFTTTYKPLIGVTSETEANGFTTYYEYDAFDRLKLIRDKDQNILKKICYNYAGQQTECSEIPSFGPCAACTGDWVKCINNQCELATRYCSAVTMQSDGTLLATYYYKWSDGSQSPNITGPLSSYSGNSECDIPLEI